MIRIVGLGPSNIELMSMGAHRIIRSAPIVLVRTSCHPAVGRLSADGVVFESMDCIYESAPTFEEVYSRIAERILEESEKGDVVYAVPGHPLVGESSVDKLVRMASDRGIDCEIIGSESFIEVVLEALGMVLDSGLKIVDALSLDRVELAADTGNLIYQVYDRDVASDVKLRLMERYPDDFEIAVVLGAGSPSQEVRRIPLYELDRCDPDHFTTVYVPPPGASSATADSGT